MAKILIVYYFRKGENYWNGSIKSIAKGNTERVAEFIQKAVGGDLFEVDTDMIRTITSALTKQKKNCRKMHVRKSRHILKTLKVMIPFL